MGFQQFQQPQYATASDESQATMILAALCLAASSNNEGATHLGNGKMQQAYECFKAALEVMNGAELSVLLQPPVVVEHQSHHQQQHQQQYHQQQQQQQQFHYPQQEQQQQDLSPSQQQQQLFPSKELQQYAIQTQQTEALLRSNPPSFTVASSSTTTAMDTSDSVSPSSFFHNSAFFVYKKPFLFTPDQSSVTKDTISLYKAQVMFNLAVLMHMGGHCVDESSVYTALNLYDLCLECSMKCGNAGTDHHQQHPDSQQNMASLMLTIASLNNKAHVFHEFCEFSSLRIVLDTLFVAMAFLPRGGTGGAAVHQVVESEQIQGILFNVYMLRELNCARAA